MYHYFFFSLFLVSVLSTCTPTPVLYTRDVDSDYPYELECDGHGKCLNITGTPQCYCDEKYAGETCSHKRKEQLTAFLLEFFLGTWGASKFYLGYIAQGVGKILLTLSLCLSTCVILGISFGVIANTDSDKGYWVFVLYGVPVLISLAILGWWLHDVIVIGLNDLNDSRGHSLVPW
jgi:hypothetical protein